MVRGERRRLHLRPGGQSRPAPSRIRCRRRSQGAPRRGRRRQDARLRQLRLRRRLVAPETPRRRPAGGDDPRLRRPLHRHLAHGGPRHLYEGVYCARGQAENLIKLHKGQLASDRTSCQSPLANQFRLVLHHRGLLADASPCAMPCLEGWRSPGPSSPPSGSACSRSARASSRRPPGSASTLPRPVPTPPVPHAGRAPRGLGTLTARATCPANQNPFNPEPDTDNIRSRRRLGVEREPCSIKINRQTLAALNKSG